MDRSYAAPLFIVFQYLENVSHILNRFGQGPIDYREAVVFDVGEAHCLGASREIGTIGTKLVDFRQVYERSDASCEQCLYLLFCDAWAPGVFTGEEERGGPVRVRDWALEDCVERGVVLLGKQNVDAVLSGGESSARQGGSGHSD